MVMKKAIKYGAVAGHLMEMKHGTPTFRVDATMDSHSGPDNMRKYDKQDHDRLKKEVGAMHDHLSKWDDAMVARKAKKSFKRDLATKKARLAELKARLDSYNDNDTDDEDDNDEDDQE